MKKLLKDNARPKYTFVYHKQYLPILQSPAPKALLVRNPDAKVCDPEELEIFIGLGPPEMICPTEIKKRFRTLTFREMWPEQDELLGMGRARRSL